MSERLEAMTDQPTPEETRGAVAHSTGSEPVRGGPGASLDRMFEQIHRFGADAVFGRPEQVGGQTIVPVASVWYGFGFGRGGGEGHEGRPASEGAGGGGGGRVTPVAVIVVEGGRVRVDPVIDVTRIVLTALLLFGGSRLMRLLK